ncbi:hypothetical protein GE107_11045 [Cohnella sp. CFH 77786]|uniref:cell wall elongation regulator TseB-like domain-containing protein n=1 Tax=Cohnella sp. CFH 77786 TaxID=2662265 RepID=UPI001C60F167|nr:DUF5590 domain-containing protein [Cohnella sp. CFH 77786]MBW5446596.1 hypothetical protein [Cohnella sp. CFH 77786]
MSLSRTESHRRLPALSMGRILFAGVSFFVLLAVAAVLHVRSADAGYRADENRAIQAAITEGGLAQVDRAVWHIWDESVWVVMGKDKDGQEWILWERKDGIVKEKLSDGFSESRIREHFASERPSAVPIRVLPGWFANRPVWEIRYRKTPRTAQQGIDFYSFKDGTLIKSYDLPGQ